MKVVSDTITNVATYVKSKFSQYITGPSKQQCCKKKNRTRSQGGAARMSAD